MSSKYSKLEKAMNYPIGKLVEGSGYNTGRLRTGTIVFMAERKGQKTYTIIPGYYIIFAETAKGLNRS